MCRYHVSIVWPLQTRRRHLPRALRRCRRWSNGAPLAVKNTEKEHDSASSSRPCSGDTSSWSPPRVPDAIEPGEEGWLRFSTPSASNFVLFSCRFSKVAQVPTFHLTRKRPSASPPGPTRVPHIKSLLRRCGLGGRSSVLLACGHGLCAPVTRKCGGIRSVFLLPPRGDRERWPGHKPVGLRAMDLKKLVNQFHERPGRFRLSERDSRVVLTTA